MAKEPWQKVQEACVTHIWCENNGTECGAPRTKADGEIGWSETTCLACYRAMAKRPEMSAFWATARRRIRELTRG